MTTSGETRATDGIFVRVYGAGVEFVETHASACPSCRMKLELVTGRGLSSTPQEELRRMADRVEHEPGLSPTLLFLEILTCAGFDITAVAGKGGPIDVFRSEWAIDLFASHARECGQCQRLSKRPDGAVTLNQAAFAALQVADCAQISFGVEYHAKTNAGHCTICSTSVEA